MESELNNQLDFIILAITIYPTWCTDGHFDGDEIELHKPGLMCWTFRGVVPHLKTDLVPKSEAVKWVHVPFQT